MTAAEMRKVHDDHLAAEARKDVAGAVATYHEDCFYENVPLGLRFEGRDAVALQYAASFATFPDADFVIEGEAHHDGGMVVWGTFRSDDVQSFLGLEPERRSISFPMVSIIAFRDGLMAGETLLYDLASVCEQLGVSVEEARAAGRALREQIGGAA